MRRPLSKSGLHLGLTACLVVSAGLLSGDCIKEVCTEDSAAFELSINFQNVDLQQAHSLMVISEVTAPDGRFDRRVRVLDMPVVFGNELQIVVDPGVWTRDPDHVASVSYKLTLRVLSQDMVLLGEGTMESTFRSGGCQSASMVVSGSVDCVLEGQPCIGVPDGAGGGHQVCRVDGGTMACRESTCGDGVVDRLAGELCDPENAAQPCNDTGGLCMPPPQVVDLAISSARRYRRAVNGVCPHDYTHKVLGAFDRDDVDPIREPGWQAILPASLAVGDFHGTSPVESSGGVNSSGQELALGAPTGWWDPEAPGECELSTSGPGQSANRRGKVVVGDLPIAGDNLQLGGSRLEPVLIGESESLYGFALAAADLNADGYEDLAISSPVGHADNGYVHVALGRTVLAEDDGAVVQPDDDRLVVIRHTKSNPQSRFGHSLAAGDLDGDGYAELILGSPGIKSSGSNNVGAVDILPGGPGRFAPGTRYEVGSNTDNPVAVRLIGDRASGRLGKSVAVGDVDGDGYGDVVTGASGAAGEVGSTINVGVVHVLFGGPELLGEAPDPIGPRQVGCLASCESGIVSGLSIQAPVDASDVDPQIRFGARVAVGDLDGDGRAEVVVSRPLLDAQDRGVVYIYRGSTLAGLREAGAVWSTADVPPDLIIYGPPNTLAMAHPQPLGPETGFGHRLLIADVNEDLQPDLVIAAPLTWVGPDGDVPPRPAAGAAYVIMGSRRASWDGELNLGDYEDGTVVANGNAQYGVVVLRGPVIGAQMGIALAAGFRVLGVEEEPVGALLLAVANNEEYPLMSTGGAVAVNLDTVFERSCGNGVLEVGEQCDCAGGLCEGTMQLGELDCADYGYGGRVGVFPACSGECHFDFSPCVADASSLPCGLQAPFVPKPVEVTVQCNENGREPMVANWGLTRLDLGFGNEGSPECYLDANSAADGSCMVNLDTCAP